MDEKDLIILLQKFGFTEKEALVYKAALALGESGATKIAVEAGIPRTHCYDILRTLDEKGLITSLSRNGRYRYSAVPPRRIQKILSERLKQFEEQLPLLEALYQGSPDKPRVRFFVGKEGIDSIHQEFLTEAREVLFFGSGEDWVKNYQDYYDFTKQLIRHKIKIREIVKRLPEMKKYGKLYKDGRHEQRFIKPEWNMPSEAALWGNKVALLTYGGSEMHGVVIESTSIYTTMRQVFEILWEIAEEI